MLKMRKIQYSIIPKTRTGAASGRPGKYAQNEWEKAIHHK
jgi:hypothetical protein